VTAGSILSASVLWVGPTLLAAGLALGCGGDREPVDPSAAAVASVTMNVEADTIVRGSVLQLEATPLDAAGNPLEDRSISWSSSDPLLATVTQTGLVEAVGLGIATITATSEGRSAAAAITLSANVTVSRRLPTTFVGDTTQLYAALSDADGTAIPGAVDEWISSNETVAVVDSDGLVTGVSAGVATILATRSGGVGAVDLVVLEPRIRANREIAYVRTVPGNLYRIRTDGTGDIPLTDPSRYLEAWSWAPDGDRIAVVYAPIFVGVAAGLYTIGADGRDVRELVPDARMVPKWSPDGSRILFVRGNPAMLHMVDADGSNLTQVGNLRTGLGGGAEWSPDGRRIGVSVASCQQFVLMDADGSNQVRVVAPHPVCGHTWSPDGKLIAYNSAGQPNNGIFLLRTDTVDPKPLTSNCNVQGQCSGTRSYFLPKWSPEGRRLAFLSQESNGTTIKVHVYDLDRQETTEFEAGGFLDYSLDWSPDGARIAFSGRKAAPPQWSAVISSLPDGSGRVEVTGDRDSYYGAWRP
jgi:Tol biopolymer transport system component